MHKISPSAIAVPLDFSLCYNHLNQVYENLFQIIDVMKQFPSYLIELLQAVAHLCSEHLYQVCQDCCSWTTSTIPVLRLIMMMMMLKMMNVQIKIKMMRIVMKKDL